MSAPCIICPVCDSRIVSLYHRRNREFPVNSFTPSASDFGVFYDLYRCEGCGIVFAADMPPERELARAYRSSRPEGYALEKKNRQRNFQRLIKTVSGYVEGNERIRLLDVGSSTGLFLDTVRKTFPDWILTGVEASASAAELARGEGGFRIIRGMFETAEEVPGGQDIVTMLDLIEHVHSPLEIICKANQYLKPGGILVLTTPNINSWTSRLFRTHWWSFRCMHTLYFSPSSMKQILARGGFRVVTIRGLIRLFSLRYCLRHLGWSIHGPSASIPFPLSLGDMLIISRKEVPVFNVSSSR